MPAMKTGSPPPITSTNPVITCRASETHASTLNIFTPSFKNFWGCAIRPPDSVATIHQKYSMSPTSRVEPHEYSPWSPEIATRFRGSNPGHPSGVSGPPPVRPEWGDIPACAALGAPACPVPDGTADRAGRPPTHPLLHHRAAPPPALLRPQKSQSDFGDWVPDMLRMSRGEAKHWGWRNGGVSDISGQKMFCPHP